MEGKKEELPLHGLATLLTQQLNKESPPSIREVRVNRQSHRRAVSDRDTLPTPRQVRRSHLSQWDNQAGTFVPKFKTDLGKPSHPGRGRRPVLPAPHPGAGSSPHRAGPGRGHRVGHSVPLLRLPVHLLVEAAEHPLHVLHGEDTDGRALSGPSVPAGEMAAEPRSLATPTLPSPARSGGPTTGT